MRQGTLETGIATGISQATIGRAPSTRAQEQTADRAAGTRGADVATANIRNAGTKIIGAGCTGAQKRTTQGIAAFLGCMDASASRLTGAGGWLRGAFGVNSLKHAPAQSADRFGFLAANTRCNARAEQAGMRGAHPSVVHRGAARFRSPYAAAALHAGTNGIGAALLPQ